MVAPHVDGRIARSMVRIPGSGLDEDAGLISLNLGNVSQFAAMIPVPQSLSFNTHNGRHQMTTSFSLGGSANQKTGVETTSLAADDAIKAEELVHSSVSLPVVDSSRVAQTQAVGVTPINRNDAPVSTPTTAPSAGINGQRSSGFKRPIRQESTEDPEALSIPKRRRVVSAAPQNRGGSCSVPTFSSQPTASSWALPLGTMRANGNTTSQMPILLPVVSSGGTPMAVPLSMVQSTNGASPTFVLQPMPSQVTRYQPVLMAATKSLPTSPSRSQTGRKSEDRQLVQERDQLKKENEALKYRLSRFHQLLRNKEKLISVLRHLDAVPS